MARSWRFERISIPPWLLAFSRRIRFSGNKVSTAARGSLRRSVFRSYDRPLVNYYLCTTRPSSQHLSVAFSKVSSHLDIRAAFRKFRVEKTRTHYYSAIKRRTKPAQENSQRGLFSTSVQGHYRLAFVLARAPLQPRRNELREPGAPSVPDFGAMGCRSSFLASAGRLWGLRRASLWQAGASARSPFTP